MMGHFSPLTPFLPPGTVIEFNAPDAFERFALLVGDDVDEEHVVATWDHIQREGGRGEVDMRTGDSTILPPINNAVAGMRRAFNAADIPPPRRAKLQPGQVATAWEHKASAPGKVFIEVRRG